MVGPPETTDAGPEVAAPSPPGQPAALRQGGTIETARAQHTGGTRSCSIYFPECVTKRFQIHPTFSLTPRLSGL